MRLVAGNKLSLKISTKAPQGFKDLAWDVFFKSRNRGISLESHFPFLERNSAYYVTIAVQDEIVAGLVVNRVTRADINFVAGLIGLVCVHPDHRGAGHSTDLLEAAICHARELDLDDLILWTGKPGIYKKLGFEAYDTGCVGTVIAKGYSRDCPAMAARCAWPTHVEQRGLPPYALKAYQWTIPDASIVLLEDATGSILAEWCGPDEEVISLLSQVMPDTWRINALKGDTLLPSLGERRWKLELRPANLQMIMNLRERDTGEIDPYKLRFLDRL